MGRVGYEVSPCLNCGYQLFFGSPMFRRNDFKTGRLVLSMCDNCPAIPGF